MSVTRPCMVIIFGRKQAGWLIIQAVECYLCRRETWTSLLCLNNVSAVRLSTYFWRVIGILGSSHSGLSKKSTVHWHPLQLESPCSVWTEVSAFGVNLSYGPVFPNYCSSCSLTHQLSAETWIVHLWDKVEGFRSLLRLLGESCIKLIVSLRGPQNSAVGAAFQHEKSKRNIQVEDKSRQI